MSTEPVAMKADDGNFLIFRWDTAKNNAASDVAGRPIFDRVLLVQIQSPGAPHQGHTQEVERELPNGAVRKSAAMYDRYGRQIAAFKQAGPAEDLQGTPIDQWQGIDVRQAAEMKAMSIYTVEALADLPDIGIQRLGPGGRTLVARAKAFLEHAAGNSPVDRLATENATLKERIALLEEQVKTLGAFIEAHADDDEPSPAPARRPRKVAA